VRPEREEDMVEEALREVVRRARGKFIAMGTTYSLGVFNDSFFKQAAILLALEAKKDTMPGHITIAFALPYIIFAAPAGWLADRFPKRAVVIGAKGLELAAMICWGVGIWTGNWTLVLVMAALMGRRGYQRHPWRVRSGGTGA